MPSAIKDEVCTNVYQYNLALSPVLITVAPSVIDIFTLYVQCSVFVKEFAPAIIQLVDDEIDPETICKVRIHVDKNVLLF